MLHAVLVLVSCASDCADLLQCLAIPAHPCMMLLQDYVDQLKLIIKVLGPPSEDDLSFINSSKARAYIRALPQQEVSCGH